VPRAARPRRGGGARWLVAKVIMGLAMIGVLAASRDFILFMNRLNPLQGLVIWYSLLAAALLIILHGSRVSVAGLGTRSLGLTEVAATLMIVWAFRIVMGVESPWAAHASGVSPSQVPGVLYQTEDGVTYTLLYNLFYAFSPHFPNIIWKTYPDFIAFMTYVVAPIALVLLACILLTAKGFQAAVARAARL